MHLNHLSLTHFRLFARLDMELPRRTLLLVGENAQGKTSLLEAIYYLATFTSLHASLDRQIVSFAAAREPLAVARIVGDFEREGRAHRLEVRLILEANGGFPPARFRKEILLDGVKRTAQEATGALTAVMFLPDMTRILDGSPEERRRYLNLALAQAVPGYAQALTDYTRALEQRNALLKLLQERNADPAQLAYWDTLLAEKGAFILHARIAAIAELERLAARIHNRLTGGTEVLQFVYLPAYDPLPRPEGQYALPILTPMDRGGFSLTQLREGFLQRLSDLRSEEIARGVTTIGPHRDELRFLSNGVDLGDYGSRGQLRTTLLSLKMAEARWMKERTGEFPILLLDEILAELDDRRRTDLLDALNDFEQAVLTTTDLKLFAQPFLSHCAVWRVTQGVVQTESPQQGEQLSPSL